MVASGTFLEISIARRPGILSRVASELARSGILILGQDLEPVNEEVQRIRFRLAVDSTVPSGLKERIEAIPGVERMGRLVQAKPSDQQLQELLRKAFHEVSGSQDSEITQTILNFGSSLPKDTRDACLVSLGRKIGNGAYRKSYSLGSPLDLPTALDRIVVPELRKFSPVSTSDGSRIALAACPFCRPQDPEPSCAYLAGVIRGLLELSPTTSAVAVTETACSHQDTGSPCEFQLSQ
ncbi:MAG: hypothetical protein K0U98_06805 [Deltaproteobacteria bacterium]|nr:hypothetical protein [Deltaproteobacteria bacterium]